MPTTGQVQLGYGVYRWAFVDPSSIVDGKIETELGPRRVTVVGNRTLVEGRPVWSDGADWREDLVERLAENARAWVGQIDVRGHIEGRKCEGTCHCRRIAREADATTWTSVRTALCKVEVK
jgi:hypothetical protein